MHNAKLYLCLREDRLNGLRKALQAVHTGNTGIGWHIPVDALTRGMLLTGPQGGGKSRFLIWLCSQLNGLSIPFFILDPKCGLRQWADHLNAFYIDIDDVSIDLSPPPGLDYQRFLPSLMSQLGDIRRYSA